MVSPYDLATEPNQNPMRELRFPYLSLHNAGCDDLAPDCAGGASCRDTASCWLHAGLLCPDDSLDDVLRYLPFLDDVLLRELAIAAGGELAIPAALPPPPSLPLRVPAAFRPGVRVCADGPAPVLPARAAVCPVRSSLLVTTSPGLPPTKREAATEPPPPRRKRRSPAKRGRRLWSLDMPPLPRAASLDVRLPTSNGGGGGGRRLVAARPRNRVHQRECTHCGNTVTPQWRAGPAGPGTLCNACGIRFTMNKLFPEYRPSTSPSFRGDEHSNRHRKVVKLREQKAQGRISRFAQPPAAPNHGDFMDVCV